MKTVQATIETAQRGPAATVHLFDLPIDTPTSIAPIAGQPVVDPSGKIIGIIDSPNAKPLDKSGKIMIRVAESIRVHKIVSAHTLATFLDAIDTPLHSQPIAALDSEWFEFSNHAYHQGLRKLACGTLIDHSDDFISTGLFEDEESGEDDVETLAKAFQRLVDIQIQTIPGFDARPILKRASCAFHTLASRAASASKKLLHGFEDRLRAFK